MIQTKSKLFIQHTNNEKKKKDEITHTVNKVCEENGIFD